MQKLRLVAAVGAALALMPATASATTYEGTCKDIAGTATFGTALTNTQGPNTYDFVGTAHCTGKVNGQAIDNAPVDIRVSGPGDLSCSQGKSTEPGKGTITMKSTGVVVSFTMEFTAIGSEVDITLHGLKSGEGTGHASFINQGDPAANLTTVTNCGGSGNKSLSFTAHAETTSTFDDGQAAPSTSTQEQPAQQPGGDSGTQQPAQQPTSGSNTQQPAAKPKPKHKKKHKKHKKPKKHHKKKHKQHKKKRH